MDPLLAAILILFGLPGAVWPYGVARFEEMVDSIGSKRSMYDVEPADWKVTITRIVGVGMVLIGLFGVFAG